MNNNSNWPFLDDSPRLEELRLSVQSLLLSGDRNLPEASSEVVGELRGKRTLSRWGVNVINDIFRQFDMEFPESHFSDPLQTSSVYTSADEGENPDALEEFVQIYYDDGESERIELTDREIQPPPELDDHDLDFHDPRFTPPLSTIESIEEPDLPRSPQQPRFSQHLPTPPTSPHTAYNKQHAPSFVEGCPECEAKAAAAAKPHSLLYNLRRQFRRHTSSGKPNGNPAQSPRGRPVTPSAPPPPRPSPPRRPGSPHIKPSGDDIRTVVRGPILKINRLSDIPLSLNLTAAEEDHIQRRRATGSGSEEDFDLVVRLGTTRTPRGSIVSRREDPALFSPDPSTIPPVPMVDPQYLLSPVASVKSANTSPTTSSKTKQKRPSRLRKQKSTPSTAGPVTEVEPETPPVEEIVVTELSEENLMKLTKATGVAPPALPSPIPVTIPVRAKERVAPTEVSLSTVMPWPVPPVPGTMRRRIPHNRYASLDQLPRAQATAIARKGGRVGTVQMGSAFKANKILGDIVLLAPERELPKRKRAKSFSAPSVASGSVAKVERLRGERLPVERIPPVPYLPPSAIAEGLKSPLSKKNRPISNGAVWVV